MQNFQILKIVFPVLFFSRPNVKEKLK